jgi:small-conductance mechanosensitive channel
MNLINQILGIPTAFAQKVAGAEVVVDQTTNQITQIVTFIIGQIPLWITALIVIVASFVLARVVKSAVENKMAIEGLEEEHKEIQIVAGRTANALVLIIGITAGLKIAGLDLTPIIAAGAFGIGFALQDLIMNFLAGVMILSARHYSIGDIIKVDGTMGKIVEIQTRATILKAFDGTKIVVPNANLFKNQVTSYTSNPFRRIELINGVAYGSDLKQVMHIVLEAVKNVKGVLIVPKPKVIFYEWGDSSINFKIWAWVDSKSAWLKTRNTILRKVNEALDKAGIEIPYPIQTIMLDKNSEKSEKELESLVTESPEVKPSPIVANAPAQLPQSPAATYPSAGLPENAEPVPEWLQKATAALNPTPSVLSSMPIAGLVSPQAANPSPSQPVIQSSIAPDQSQLMQAIQPQAFQQVQQPQQQPAQNVPYPNEPQNAPQPQNQAAQPAPTQNLI